jgi:hypothetical protein
MLDLPSPPSGGTDVGAARTSPWRLRLAVALVVLAALAPLVEPWTAQPGSRFGLTAAVVDDQSLQIDPYLEGTAPIDRIEVDGHFYSDKAPGQPFAAVPFWWIARRIGAEPADTLIENDDGRLDVRDEGNLGLWWLTLWTSVLPLAVLAVVMQVLAARHVPRTSVQAALALVFGTMFLVLGPTLYGHALTAVLGLGAWAVLSSRRALTPTRLLAAGALAGAAVVVEFPVVIVAAALTIWLVVRRRSLVDLAWWGLGAAPFAALLLWYQAVAFGDPFSVSYDHKDVGQASDTLAGLPRSDVVVNSLVGSRGLLVYSPIVLVAVIAAVLIVRRRHASIGVEVVAEDDGPGGLRDHAWMALAVLGTFLLMVVTRQTDWPNPIGGEVPFVRYVAPALPFLAVPLAWGWARWRVPCLVATVIGAAVLALPLFTDHLIPGDASAVSYYWQRIQDEGVVPNVFTLALGPAGWVVHGALVALAVWHLWRTTAWYRDQARTPEPIG